jgi:hypothetical protein
MANKFLQDIQKKLFDTTKKLYVFRKYNENDMNLDLLNYNIEPNVETFSRMLRIFQKWELEREFFPIMELLWKMTVKSIEPDDYPYLKLEEAEKSNWRVILSRHPRYPVDPLKF